MNNNDELLLILSLRNICDRKLLLYQGLHFYCLYQFKQPDG
jgi:hypothetical protein